MVNPVLVEVVRGAAVESRHRGAVAVCDAEGADYLTIGDVATPIFPRSAVKPFQALPLVESGAADEFELSDKALAIACASHGGEAEHVAAVEAFLARAGLDAGALECGAHWPLHQASARALVREHRTPHALHNNCSGKHAGMLSLARQMKVDHRHYIGAEHPVQREVRATLAGMFDLKLDDHGIDGCSIPTYAVPLRNVARAFARFGTGRHIGERRFAAAQRLMRCCAEHPFYVGGTERFCTAILGGLQNRAFVKIGAEGVIGGVIRELGLGIAVKCDDGGQRAAEVVMASLLLRLLPLSSADGAFLETRARPPLKNWNSLAVGELRPAEALTAK
ncbi:MAG: asparaginase [Xanthobacteraceae bacterium]|nr:asparaginase [Xanthobacteraceae bacterium]